MDASAADENDAGIDASAPDGNDDAGMDASTPSENDDAGMDASTPSENDAAIDASTPNDDAGGPLPELECRVFRAHSGDKSGPYKVGIAKDKYFNFSFANPWPGTRYGVLLRPIIDGSAVQQISLFHAPVTVGQDGAVQASNGTHPDGELMFLWAPGASALDFRSLAGNAGFEFAPDRGLVLEFHYDSIVPQAQDASGIEVCVQKEKPAQIAGISWLGTDVIFGASASGTCAHTSDAPIDVLSILPRMRAKGTHIRSLIKRAGGSEELLHDAAFTSSSHAWYPKDVALQPGDHITTTCTYKGFPSYGTALSEEVCWLLTVASPKHALSDGQPIGSAFHGKGACLGL